MLQVPSIRGPWKLQSHSEEHSMNLQEQVVEFHMEYMVVWRGVIILKKFFQSPEKENVKEVTNFIATGGQFCCLMIFLVSESAINQVPLLMIIAVMLVVLLDVLFIWNSFLLYDTSSWCPLAKCEELLSSQVEAEITVSALPSLAFTWDLKALVEEINTVLGKSIQRNAPKALVENDFVKVAAFFDVALRFTLIMKADTQENPTLSSAFILVSKLEELASNKSFNVKEKGCNFDDADFEERRKGQLAIDAEIFRDYAFFSCGGSEQNNL